MAGRGSVAGGVDDGGFGGAMIRFRGGHGRRRCRLVGGDAVVVFGGSSQPAGSMIIWGRGLACVGGHPPCVTERL